MAGFAGTPVSTPTPPHLSILQVNASLLHRNTPVSSNATGVTRSISEKLVDAWVTELGNIYAPSARAVTVVFFFFFFFFFLRYVARVFSSFPVAFKPLTKGEYPLGRKFEPHLIFMYLPGMFFTLLSRKARCSLNGNNLCSNSLLVLEALSLRLLHYYFYLLAFFTLFLFSIFFFAVLFVYISIRALTFIQDVLQGYRNFFVLSDSRQASFIL